jgi:hypothetical protein
MSEFSHATLLVDIDALIPEVGSRSRVYELIGSGQIKAVKLGTSTKILAQSYRDFVDRLPPAQIAPPRPRKRSAAVAA